jgi:hypothetical protein
MTVCRSPNQGRMIDPEPNGQAALILCETLVHLLVEKGVLSKHEVCDVIAGAEEIAREVESYPKEAVARRSVSSLLQAIRQSLEAK